MQLLPLLISPATASPHHRQVLQCPFPKVKLGLGELEMQGTAAWFPHLLTTVAAPTSEHRPGTCSIDGVTIPWFLFQVTPRTFFKWKRAPFPSPGGVGMQFPHSRNIASVTEINVPPYQSLVQYIRAAVLNA
ncbi:hypothetical protein GOODEAATRI_004814 [Goodea atripinnis]|uniref:Uncharacterized protein n=1 Tax=Goodea atripinnis TaxID=208336 RepID=A0ABV0N7X8_9TELE